MNQVDTLLLILLTPFALRGFWRGLCREAFGLVGLLGGAAAAGVASPSVAALLVAHHVLPALAARPAAFVAIYAVVVVTASMCGLVTDRLLRTLLLGGINRAAGAAFGIAKGAVLAGFALLLVQRMAPSLALAPEIERSRLARPLVHLAAGVLQVGRDHGIWRGA